MHPINKLNFGVHGLAVQYWNGTSVVAGYITRQLGSTRYAVTDGTHPANVTLAQTTAIATALASSGNHSFCTMSVVPPGGAATGATITPTFGIDTAVIAAAGTGYVVGNVLTPTGVAGATVTVATIDGSGGITALTVSAVGGTTSLPSNPVPTTGGAGTGATLTLKYKIVSIASSGGTGYIVGEVLHFTGMVATTLPTAHIATSVSGAATTVTVDTPGVGITAAGSGVTAGSGAQHVRNLEDAVAWTTEGNKLHWTLGLAVNGSSYIATFS